MLLGINKWLVLVLFCRHKEYDFYFVLRYKEGSKELDSQMFEVILNTFEIMKSLYRPRDPYYNAIANQLIKHLKQNFVEKELKTRTIRN